MIDANVAVRAVLHVLDEPLAARRMAEWRRQGAQLVAPALWLSEVATSVRREWHAGVIREEQAHRALEYLLLLGIELVPMTADHARSALRWAARVRQSRAHDGFYLAVAEELGTELWTADQRLANAAQAAGAGWAHWIGEPS